MKYTRGIVKTKFLITFLQELQQIRNSLPDTVKIQRVEERLSALGKFYMQACFCATIVASEHYRKNVVLL